jgi:CRP/FNR family transcriptional regulator
VAPKGIVMIMNEHSGTRRHEGCALCPTRGLCVARNLSDAALGVLGETISTTTPMKKGEYLYRAGDQASAWFVVRSGVYKTIIDTPDGDEYVTGFYYPGELLGLEGAADGRFDESALALGSATACAVSLGNLPRIWALGADRSILSLIAEHERNEKALRINMSQSRADVRIAGFLALLMARTERLGFDPRSLPMPMSRTDLANHLGLTLECVSRVLSRWRKAGVIDVDKSTLRVLNAEALTTAAPHLAGLCLLGEGTRRAGTNLAA